MSAIVHLDYETFSEAPLQGKESVGAFRYANDPSTEILLAGLWLDDGSNEVNPSVWVNPSLGWTVEAEEQREAYRLLKLCEDPTTIIYAHNAPFEVAITLARWMDDIFPKGNVRVPTPDQFRCTMAMARTANLPPALEDLAGILRLGETKDTRGHNLIRKFSVPQKARKLKPTTNPKLLAKRALNPHKDRIMPMDSMETQNEFERFIEYCRQDVKVEVECHRALHYFEMSGDMLDLFQCDLRMNVRGFPVNIEGLKNAEKVVQAVEEQLGKEFYELTGLKHTQREKVFNWLVERGFSAGNLQADTLDSFLEENPDFDDDTEIGKALRIKQKLGYAAIKKIRAMLRMAGPHDNKVRGTLIAFGAGPGRWTGFGVQPQNFKRPSQDLVKDWFAKFGYPDEDTALSDLTATAYKAICAGMVDIEMIDMLFGPPLEVLSSCIRHFIHDIDELGAQPMLSADYNAIEARTVAWLSYQDDALELYRQGVCRYKHMASKIYRVPIDKVNKFPQRFVGKQAILLLGYQGGGAKFRMTCEKYSYFDLPEKLEFDVVKMFRDEHKLIVKQWHESERSAKKAILHHGQRFKAGRCSYYTRITGGMKFLFCVLPSGREIAYPFPKVEPSLSYQYKGKKVQIINPSSDDIQAAARRCGKESERFGDGGYMLKDVVTYYSKMEGKQTWGRSAVYGGLLVENQSQGCAADIMMNGVVVADRHGYLPATLIHDEFLGYKTNPNQNEKELCRLLADNIPAWADGLPVAAEGAEVEYYTK